MAISEAAFATIVKDSKGAVLSAIHRYLSPALHFYIDDIAQETYYQAYKKLSKSNPEDIAAMHNYLFTIAKNESIRINKKEDQYKKMITELTYDRPNEMSPSLSELANIKDLIEDIPQKYKTVTQLFLKGCSLKEISESLNLKLGTVKSKLYRGRQHLVANYKRTQ